MIEFIVYENNPTLKEIIKNTIYKILGNKNEEFKVLDYNEEVINNKCKIYIISSTNYNEVINIAKKIRNISNFNNPIIVISNIKEHKLNNDLLIFNYINMDETTPIKLAKAINKAYNMLIEINTFNFTYNRIVYRIPLKNILYIEKEINSNKALIHTKDTIYETNKSIKEIEINIKCPSFMKVHRSCIVNLNNVKKYDYYNNELYFENKNTNLICREKRSIIKEKLLFLKNQ